MNRFGWTLLAVFLGIAAFAFAGSRTGPPHSAPQAEGNAPRLIVPVQGVRPGALTDTWGQSREGGARAHEAIDIPAPMGTPVRAAMAGRVEKLFSSARGGLTAYIRSTDGGWMAYYAHLSAYADDLREGQMVLQGQVIAYVGDTGNAGAGNTHLHFALSRMAAGERWWQGAPVNPYPLLARAAPAR